MSGWEFIVSAADNQVALIDRITILLQTCFASVLRSLSQGRASFSMLPAGFEPLDEAGLRARGLL